MPTLDDLAIDKQQIKTMPYPSIPQEDTPKIERCVNALLADPKFKPSDPKMDKKSAAIAVCIKKYKDSQGEDEEEEEEYEAAIKTKSQKDLKKTKEASAYEAIYQTYLAKTFSAQPATEIKIVPFGRYETTKYGEVEITEDDISNMVKNFDPAMGVPIDIDHKNEEAVGWVNKLINKGREGLWGMVEWSKRGLELLKDKAYKGISPEFALEYMDPESSQKQDATLIAVSLTNFPLFQKALKQSLMAKNDLDNKIILTFKKENMSKNLKAALKLQCAKLSPEQKALIQDNWDKLSSEEKARFKDIKPTPKEEIKEIKPEPKPEPKPEVKPAPKPVEIKKEVEPKKEEPKVEPVKETPTPEVPVEPVKEEKKEPVKEEKVEKPVETPKEEPKKEEPVITPVDKKVEANIKYEASIKAAEERAKKFETELIRLKVERQVTDSLLFNSRGGKFAPKAKDDLVDLIMSMSSKQLALFNRVVNAIPGKKVFGEIGKSSATPLQGQKLIEKLISEKILASKKLGKKVDYTQAFIEVGHERPELFRG